MEMCLALAEKRKVTDTTNVLKQTKTGKGVQDQGCCTISWIR